MAQERATAWQHASSPAALVRDLIEKGIHDKRLLDAFTQIRRGDFIPQEFVSDAYRDEPVNIGHRQVTTQPSLIALMVQALRLTGTEKVLEIGTGFGFQTAILSRLCQLASALGKNRPFRLTKSDPHEEHDLPLGKKNWQAISFTPKACGLLVHHPRRRRVSC